MFEIYNKFVHFIRDLHPLVFAAIMAAFFVGILIFLIGFIKANDSKSEKLISKAGNLIIIVIFLAICIFLISIR